MKKRLTTIMLFAMLFIGLTLILYPPVSNWWNSFHQSRAVSRYTENVSSMKAEEYKRIMTEAADYNRRIVGDVRVGKKMTSSQQAEYNSMLNIDSSGIMAYVQIDKIGCTLPIYHGTSKGVLQIAIGHIEGSSLPVGGESTHCVLSGHRGLPSAKLFTDIVDLVEGDTFVIRTLNEILTYQVDQIHIVLPGELTDLQIVEGEDLCTLVTCTPYGINTHRLLVRGHRIETKPGQITVTSEAIQIKPVVVMPAIALPILVPLFIYMLIWSGKKSSKTLINDYKRERDGVPDPVKKKRKHRDKKTEKE